MYIEAYYDARASIVDGDKQLRGRVDDDVVAELLRPDPRRGAAIISRL